jgi:hypothetical protein
LLEKGALEVCMCKVKPMNFMDVNPYCNAISDVCLRMHTQGHHVHGVNTQTGVSHLKRDGFHILPSFSMLLEKTYTCAIIWGPGGLSHTSLGQVPGPDFER